MNIEREILNIKPIKIDNYLILTIAISIAAYIPFLTIAGNIHPIIHDQLDGDLLTYIMQARNFSLSDIPQFMDGTKSSLTMPAPGFIFLFAIFKSLTAYKLMQFIAIVVGSSGMYLLAKKLGASSWIQVSVAIMFILLPFYTVYGLSIMGLPLLVVAIISIIQNEHTLASYAYCCLYAVFSSLTLVGFAVIAFLALFIIFFLVRKDRKVSLLLVIALLCLSVVYVLVNMDLFIGIIKPAEALHREEFVRSSSSFRQNFWEMLKNGSYHEGSIHYRIYRLALPMVIYSLISIPVLNRLRKKNNKHIKYVLFSTYAVALGIVFFYGFWHSSKITAWKNSVGGIIKTFQFDRFYFLNPLVWYVLLICILVIVEKDINNFGKIARKAGIVIQAIIVLWCGIYIIDNNVSLRSDWNYVAKDHEVILFEENVSSRTWDGFWDSGNFEEVSSYIKRKYNTEKDAYKIISVGLYPSVALYNGYTCADGYSNNYTLEYKHKFGAIIEPELGKSESLSRYFYNWGNRCYVFSSEINGYYFDKNSGKNIESLSLNPDAIRDLDIGYVISAVPLTNFQENDLSYESDFVSDLSNYHLYLYKVIAK